MNQILANNFVSENITENINVLESRIETHKLQLLGLQKEYTIWSKKKADIVTEWSYDLEKLYILQGKPINTIARDIVKEMTKLGVSEGGLDYAHEKIDTRFKRDYTLGKAIRDSNAGKPGLLKLSTEEQILEDVQAIQEKLSNLPDSRRNRIVNTVVEEVKEAPEVTKKKKEKGDYGIHQAEPPKEQQGPSNFSMAIGDTAAFFEECARRFRKIESEVEIYRSNDDVSRAKDWNKYVNETILQNILSPIFLEETDAEADRKYSTSKFHWVGIIKNRIKQSKHGAGKMAENFITNPVTGEIMYTDKGKVILRGDSRERVGDFERPIVEFAERVIAANRGLLTLHDWLENEQGGHRRFRKFYLHKYFADASMGSIKSGNPNYPEYMAKYKEQMDTELGIVRDIDVNSGTDQT